MNAPDLNKNYSSSRLSPRQQISAQRKSTRPLSRLKLLAQRGGVIVELAILVPVLLTLIAGGINLSVMMYNVWVIKTEALAYGISAATKSRHPWHVTIATYDIMAENVVNMEELNVKVVPAGSNRFYLEASGYYIPMFFYIGFTTSIPITLRSYGYHP